MHHSSRQRIVLCERCRRPVAAGQPVCPHCDHHRLPQAAYIPRLPGPVVTIERSDVETARIPLRAMIIFAMALLALSGYVSLRESGLDARLEAMPSYRWLGSIDEEQNLLAKAITQTHWQESIKIR
jgi:hypothetical protein